MDFSTLKFSLQRNLYLILFLLVGLWTVPLPRQFPAPGLDPSWAIGLDIAFLHNLQYGKDIVFTLGPFAFIKYPLIIDHTIWQISTVYLFFVHFLFIIATYLFLRRFSARWYHYLLFIGIFFLVLSTILVTWWLLISLAILLYLILTRKESSRLTIPGLLFCGFFLALGSYLKFDIFYNSLYLIAAFGVLSFLLHRDLRQEAILAGSYVLSFFALWRIAGQNFSNLVPYLIDGYNITKSYTEAMALQGPAWQLIIGVLSGILVILLAACSIATGKQKIMVFFAFTAFIFFTAFKSGFVRHDLHIIFFLTIYLYLFGIVLVLFSQETSGTKSHTRSPPLSSMILPAMLVLSLAICVSTPWLVEENIAVPTPTYDITWRLMSNVSYFDQLAANEKEIVRTAYPLRSSFVQNIGSAPVDVFPWDVALCWAYDLNWSPRPVFQSQGVYSNYLDDMNSLHFQGPGSPEDVLFTYNSLDGRYPLFDEPRTFETILHRYTYVDESGGFILLSRSPEPRGGAGLDLGSKTGQIGTPVSLPEYPGEIFGEIDIRYSPPGKIVSLLYKPDPVFIRFKLKSGQTTQRYRIIPGLVKNPVFLSQFVGDTGTLSWIFRGNLVNDVESVTIETDNPGIYVPEYTIRFTGGDVGKKPENSILFDHPLEEDRILPQQKGRTYSFVSIGGETKVAFFEHSMVNGSLIAIRDVAIPGNSTLDFSIGVDPAAWSSDKGDGVEYQVFIDNTTPEDRVFAQYIDPGQNPGERRWNSYQVDLSRYAGRNVTFFFSTLPGPANETSNDWAWWGDLSIEEGRSEG
jgi:hypothetical protein